MRNCLKYYGFFFPSGEIACIGQLIKLSRFQHRVWSMRSDQLVSEALHLAKKIFPELFLARFEKSYVYTEDFFNISLDLIMSLDRLSVSLIIFKPGPEVLVALMLTSTMSFLLYNLRQGFICRSYAISSLVAQTIAGALPITELFGVGKTALAFTDRWKMQCELYEANVIERDELDIHEYRLSHHTVAMTMLSKGDPKSASGLFEYYLNWTEGAGFGTDEKAHSYRMVYLHPLLALEGRVYDLLDISLVDSNHCDERDKDGIAALEANMYLSSFFGLANNFESSLEYYFKGMKQDFFANKVHKDVS